MVQDLAIRVKALMLFLVSLLIMGAIVGAFSYWKMHQSLEQDAFAAMSGMREVKKKQIEYYFERLRLETQTVTQSPVVKTACAHLLQAFNVIPQEFTLTAEQLESYKKAVVDYYKNDFIKKLNAQAFEDYSYENYLPATDAAYILQFLYIVSNPNPVGSKGFLNQATDGSSYSLLHGKFQNILNDIVRRFGFYDMYLIDPESGTVVYSVNKEVDFATSLKVGPYRNSDLAHVYEQCAASTNKDFIIFSDYKSYAPAFGAAVQFIGASIYDGDKKVAILAFQVQAKDINSFMTNNDEWNQLGLGKTGEIYLVGQDYKMRSISRLFVEDPKEYLAIIERQGVAKKIIDQMRINQTTILLQEVNTTPVKELFRGQISTAYNSNYLGTPVLSAYSQLSIPGISWGIIVEKHEQEIFAPAKKLALMLLIIIALLSLILFWIMYSFIKMLSEQINGFVVNMQQLADDYALSKLRPIVVQRQDEIGGLIHLYNGTITRLQKLFKRMNTSHGSIDTTLKNVIQVSNDVEHYKNLLNERVAKIDTLSQSMMQQITGCSVYAKQLHDAVNNINNSALGFTSSFALIATYAKKAEEILSTIRKTAHDERINDLNNIIININSTMVACEQNINMLHTYLDRAQDINIQEHEPNEFIANQINLIVHESQIDFQQFADQVNHLMDLCKQMKKLNGELGKLLAHLISA